MYSRFQLVTKYLNYCLTASNGRGHGMHSPFVFDFIRTVLNDREEHAAYEKVEKLREQLLADRRILTIEDFGAGSTLGPSKQRTIASIAKTAAKPRKYGQLLYRIVKRYHPHTILELGTSLGITTSYLAMAANEAKVITMEGSVDIASVALQNFRQLQVPGIQLIQGNFEDTLPVAISQLQKIDFAFVDGNHRKEPTQRYFHQLLTKIQDHSILVFDDIHWSREMEEAWNEIKGNPAVTCSIDLFFIGIIFFRKEFIEKQHFQIRF